MGDSTDADAVFEVQKWEWYGIDNRAVAAQNHNDNSFKMAGSPKAFPKLIYSYTVSLSND